MGAPMPAEIRHYVRAHQHPARAVPCPHCKAHPRQACTTPSKRHVQEKPHDSRVNAWITSITVCTTCQVEPGIPCHLDGWPLKDGAVHPARSAMAEVTAA